MYSILKDSKKFREPDSRHFAPSAEGSSNSLLHLSYRLSDLQSEIEKRTFYLGKYRKADEAQHLLDLIGMSRDEGDLLYSFAKASMADVYDYINRYTLCIAKKYEWKSRTSDPISVSANPAPGLLTPYITCSKGDDEKSINIDGTFTLANTIDPALYKVGFDITVTYTTKFTASGTEITRTKTKQVHVNEDNCFCTNQTTRTWKIATQNVPVELEPQSSIHTEELIDSVTASPGVISTSTKVSAIEPIILHVGDLINYSNVIYEIVNDTDSNKLDLTTDVVRIDEVDEFTEGIHYYLSVPSYINESAVAPLDTSILESLVNLIIFKWLTLAYPAEAEVYLKLYQASVETIRERCGIFRKNWQKNPRVF